MSEKDLCGQRFGKLVILQKTEKPPQCKTRGDYWLCRCDCGNETVVLGSNLRRGHTTSCGCKKLRDLTGQHIGKLTVLGRSDKYASRGKRRVRLWECICDCGNVTYKATDTLTSGAENSCAECAAKHNAARARENAGYVDGTQLAKIKDMTPSAANTSGCRGVYFDRRKGLWEAIIIFQRKRHRLGYFKNYDDAVAARKKADKAGNVSAEITVTVNNGHTFGEWQSNGDGTHTRYCTVTGCNGSEDGDCEGGQASYFKKAVCDECNKAYGELLTDKTAPTGEISIGTNKWNSFLNTITFGLFFKDTQSVTVTAADDSYNHDGYTDDKAVKVAYYLHSGDTVLTKEDLASKEFTIYDGGFNINPDNKYVIYARLTDHAGNVTYISSEGIVLDATVPVITGVENGKTYCEAQSVTVTEEYIESVKVNGTAVTLDENNQFTLNPAEGTQKIVATDKAGNVSAEMIVTVNDGHTYEWQDDNGQYWKKCKFCGDETAEKDIPTITIDGANAVCVTQEYKFSFTLPQGATDAVYGYEFENKGDDGLPAIIENNELFGIVPVTEYEPSENSFKVYAGAKTADGFEFFVSKTVQIQNKHAGGVATCVELAICDTCGEEYGELDSTNHNLEKISAKAATVTETGNEEYWHCLDCGKYFADEKGTNEIKLDDTVIAKLPPEIIEGKGQSVTEGEKKELTFRSNAAFSDFIRAQLDGKNLDEKNYTVKEGSTVVTLKADYVATLSAGEHKIGIVSESGTATTTFTVNAKAVADNDTKSPQTGDNSHTALWIAVLLASGGVFATTVVSKKKKHGKH